MLSCYDAELCYDSRTDTFQARYVQQLTPSILLSLGANQLVFLPVLLSFWFNSEVILTYEILKDTGDDTNNLRKRENN